MMAMIPPVEEPLSLVLLGFGAGVVVVGFAGAVDVGAEVDLVVVGLGLVVVGFAVVGFAGAVGVAAGVVLAGRVVVGFVEEGGTTEVVGAVVVLVDGTGSEVGGVVEASASDCSFAR